LPYLCRSNHIVPIRQQDWSSPWTSCTNVRTPESSRYL
jgi:hypothetical protein